MKTLIERIEIAKQEERKNKFIWEDNQSIDAEANMLIATAKLEYLYIISMVNKIKGNDKEDAKFCKDVAGDDLKTAQLNAENGCIEGVKDATNHIHKTWKQISNMVLTAKQA